MLNTIQYLSVPRVCLKCTQSVSGSSDQVGLSHLGPSVTISENIGPFFTIQDHLCPQRTISDISDHFGPSLNIRDHIRLSVHHVPSPQTIWDHLGQSVTVWDHLSPYQTISLQLGSTHPIHPNLRPLKTILDYLKLYQIISDDLAPPTLRKTILHQIRCFFTQCVNDP